MGGNEVAPEEDLQLTAQLLPGLDERRLRASGDAGARLVDDTAPVVVVSLVPFPQAAAKAAAPVR